MVRLKTYNNDWYHPGRSMLWQLAWLLFGLPTLRSEFNLSSGLKVLLLRWFGAHIGSGVVIKPGVRVKYPWNLNVGNDCWIGEDCWIDNLVDVRLGDDVCLSQGAYLCTGNHDWSDPAFGLIVGPITLADGAWAGAKSTLAPNVQMGGMLSRGRRKYGGKEAFPLTKFTPGTLLALFAAETSVSPIRCRP